MLGDTRVDKKKQQSRTTRAQLPCFHSRVAISVCCPSRAYCTLSVMLLWPLHARYCRSTPLLAHFDREAKLFGLVQIISALRRRNDVDFWCRFSFFICPVCGDDETVGETDPGQAKHERSPCTTSPGKQYKSKKNHTEHNKQQLLFSSNTQTHSCIPPNNTFAETFSQWPLGATDTRIIIKLAKVCASIYRDQQLLHFAAGQLPDCNFTNERSDVRTTTLNQPERTNIHTKSNMDSDGAARSN